MFDFIERRLLFRPVSAARSWVEPPSALHAQDVFLPISKSVTIHAWWCVPDGWLPENGVVLYSHGNAGNLSHRAEGVGRWLSLLGRAVLLYDYPGYGKSTGKPGEPGCYAAGEAGLEWISREAGVSPEQILLYGGSLGGAIAIELATRRPHRALVSVSAFTSVPDMAKKQYPWLPAGPFLRHRFDNLSKIGRCRGRVFLAHGTADRYVPFSMGERLFAAAPAPKRFFPMIDHDHYHSPGPDFYVELRRFLDGSSPGEIA